MIRLNSSAFCPYQTPPHSTAPNPRQSAMVVYVSPAGRLVIQSDSTTGHSVVSQETPAVGSGHSGPAKTEPDGEVHVVVTQAHVDVVGLLPHLRISGVGVPVHAAAWDHRQEPGGAPVLVQEAVDARGERLDLRAREPDMPPPVAFEQRNTAAEVEGGRHLAKVARVHTRCQARRLSGIVDDVL